MFLTLPSAPQILQGDGSARLIGLDCFVSFSQLRAVRLGPQLAGRYGGELNTSSYLSSLSY